MTVREYGAGLRMGAASDARSARTWPPYPGLMLNSVTVRGQCITRRTATGVCRSWRAGLLPGPEEVPTFGLDRANEPWPTPPSRRPVSPAPPPPHGE